MRRRSDAFQARVEAFRAFFLKHAPFAVPDAQLALTQVRGPAQESALHQLTLRRELRGCPRPSCTDCCMLWHTHCDPAALNMSYTCYTIFLWANELPLSLLSASSQLPHSIALVTCKHIAGGQTY